VILSIESGKVVHYTCQAGEKAREVKKLNNNCYAWRKWTIKISEKSIIAESKTAKNLIVYEVSDNGDAVTTCHTDKDVKIIRKDTVFSGFRGQQGFSGTLYLACLPNGYRNARFESQEYQKFIREKGITWVLNQGTSSVRMQKLSAITQVYQRDGVTIVSSGHRLLETDGKICFRVQGDRSIIGVQGGTYAISRKYHCCSGQLEAVLHQSHGSFMATAN